MPDLLPPLPPSLTAVKQQRSFTSMPEPDDITRVYRELGHCQTLPLAVSFFVLIILAAYSWPVDFFTHLRTTEKAPLGRKKKKKKDSVMSHM